MFAFIICIFIIYLTIQEVKHDPKRVEQLRINSKSNKKKNNKDTTSMKKKTGIRLGLFSSVFSNMQIIGTLFPYLNLGLPMPHVPKELYDLLGNIINIFTINLPSFLVAPECEVKLESINERYRFQFFAPLFMFILFSIIMGIGLKYNHRTDLTFDLVLAVFLHLYLINSLKTLVDSILSPWDCTFHGNDPNNLIPVLDEDITIPCTFANEQYLEMFILSIIGFVLYILLPFLYILRHGYGFTIIPTKPVNDDDETNDGRNKTRCCLQCYTCKCSIKSTALKVEKLEHLLKFQIQKM